MASAPAHRVGAEGADEDVELGDEAGEARQADRRQAGDHEEDGEPRHLARQAAEDRQLARVRLVVDGADHGEHEGRHDAVREHLQRGAVDADRVQRRQAQEHVAHVADADE